MDIETGCKMDGAMVLMRGLKKKHQDKASLLTEEEKTKKSHQQIRLFNKLTAKLCRRCLYSKLVSTSSSSTSRSGDLKNIAIGAMAITIVGLVLIVAALIYTLETYTPEAELIFPPYIEAAYGQVQEQQQEDNATTTFQSIADGFRVQVPSGWIVEDLDSTDSWIQQFLRQYGVESLAAMCPENQGLPGIGGLYSCTLQSPSAIAVDIYRFVNLQKIPEFSALVGENKSITTSDLLTLFTEHMRKLYPDTLQDIEIVNNTDIAVNVTDSQTNQTIGAVPAKYVEYIHYSPVGVGTYKEFVLLALSNDTNTGYIVQPVIREGLESSREAPAFVRKILDSFELVTPPPTTPTAATGTTLLPRG